jgi:hypothetical protein
MVSGEEEYMDTTTSTTGSGVGSAGSVEGADGQSNDGSLAGGTNTTAPTGEETVRTVVEKERYMNTEDWLILFLLLIVIFLAANKLIKKSKGRDEEENPEEEEE